MPHLISDVQYVGESHLGYRVGTIRRYICHDNAMPVGSLHIYHIVTRSKHAYVFQFGQLAENFFCDTDFVDYNGIGILCPFHDLLGGCLRIERECAPLFQPVPRQVSWVGSQTV